MFYIHDGCSCPSLASSHSNGCPSYPPSFARTKQGVLLLPNCKAVTVSPPCLLGRDSCPRWVSESEGWSVSSEAITALQ